MFYMFPDSKSEWKKGETGQSFIWKEITSYRIGTLVGIVQNIFISVEKAFLCTNFFQKRDNIQGGLYLRISYTYLKKVIINSFIFWDTVLLLEKLLK